MAERKRGARLRLEAAGIASLSVVDGKRTEYADTVQPGLVLRVTPNGVRTWSLKYRAGSQVRRLKLGRWPRMTLGQARAAARRARGRVDAGGDPHAERVEDRRARAARLRELTLAVVFDRFVEHLQRGDFGRTTRVQWPQMIRKDLLPTLGHLRPDDRRVRGAIARAVDGVMRRGAPAQANRTLDLARRAWRWGVERGLIAWDAPYPFLGLRKPHKARPRGRWYSLAEIEALWAAVAGEADVYRDWWRLLWWTGARSSEVAEMQWSELDLETGRWVRQRTKGGTALVLTLPRQAREALLAREQEAPWVFPSPAGRTAPWGRASARERARGPLSHGARWWLAERLRGEPGKRRRRPGGPAHPVVVADYQHHDVRRTVRTGLAELGVRFEVAEMVLGHAKGRLRATYDRHLYQAEIAAALQRWADRLEKLVTSGL